MQFVTYRCLQERFNRKLIFPGGALIEYLMWPILWQYTKHIQKDNIACSLFAVRKNIFPANAAMTVVTW
jgi:hypothetical protein